MHYFSLHLPDTEEQIGFFLIHSDEDSHESGQFAIKLNHPISIDLPQSLLNLETSETALFWQQSKDKITLIDGDGSIVGTLHQQYLSLQSRIFLLNDLTGAI